MDTNEDISSKLKNLKEDTARLDDITRKLKGIKVDILSRNQNQNKIVVREGVISSVGTYHLFLENLGVSFACSNEGIVAIQTQDCRPIYRNPAVSDAYALDKPILDSIEQDKIRSMGKFYLENLK